MEHLCSEEGWHFKRLWLLFPLALLGLLATLNTASSDSAPKDGSSLSSRSNASSPSGRFFYARKREPNRTVVTDTAGNWRATFTDGAHTVSLAGPTRTLSEQSATYSVKSSVWVRELPQPFDGEVDESWLEQALSDTSSDLLRSAMQYTEGAPAIYDSAGLKIAGDADYGPLKPDGTREAGSDFSDYLGIPWTYGGTAKQPKADRINSIDCSGFMRMLFGYRSKLPLTLAPDGSAIPRRAYQILASAPGVVTIPDTGERATSLAKLAPGDLVFFDANSDSSQINHVGMYLGVDEGGNYRFVSSRKSINGPTMGDYHGKSILNGSGLYAKAFRAARRL